MIVAGGRTGAEGADGAAAGASDFDVADRVLFASEMLFSQSDGKIDEEKEGEREGKEDLQQHSKNPHNRIRPSRRRYPRST